jgi:predicted oxidoreductase
MAFFTFRVGTKGNTRVAEQSYKTEVVVAGGGIAGIVTAYELLDRGKQVILIDKDSEAKFGGLAKESFGGIMMVGTPHQKRMRIPDSPELALRDWHSYAHFGEADLWPKKWAEFYCHNSLEYIFHFLDSKSIKFLPVVNWPERGLNEPGNTVPRWHITWGTGYEIIVKLLAALEKHGKRGNLQILFEHEVSGLDLTDGHATGVHGKKMRDGGEYRVSAEHVVIASGGMCGGDLSKVRANWFKEWGSPPEHLLNGAHPYGDGLLHDRVADLGGAVTHLDKQWHYAAGVHHPEKRKPFDGLSLVPPRSALWVNAHGKRIMNPGPLVPYADTRHLVASVLKEPGQYSWQVLNWKIAIKELAVSGCNYMEAFRNKSKALLVQGLLFGNKDLVRRLMNDIPEDFVSANSLPELVDKMNERNLYGLQTDLATLQSEIKYYDGQIEAGPAYFNDDQLRRIMNFRTYRGDKIRTCKYQKIVDEKAMPLIAIREFILARKSLGGIQTDLQCRVLRQDGNAIPGLYAVGEAAGFGGGGAHGLGSLEGTFLGACVLTGRVAGQSISGA